jgi:D-mannonate dehydratase
MDMWRSIQVYREVGYRYMLMPDHVPHISGRDPQGVAFAYVYGYITAMLQALGELPSTAQQPPAHGRPRMTAGHQGRLGR